MILKQFNRDIIKLQDPERVVASIVDKIRNDIFINLKRKGGVIGLSGGIDSSLCCALATKALSPENVIGIIMPDKDSSSESESLAMELAKKFKVNYIKEDITNALTGLNCYTRRDEAVKRAFPDYNPTKDRMKIGIEQNSVFSNLPPLFTLTISRNLSTAYKKRLSLKDYLQIVAASNLKQRTRMSILYYYAEMYHYSVIGTPNKHEQEQGFFVKYGDGGADIMPIGNLYKTQIYQLAEFLEIPKAIIERTPTTDTYSAEQTQTEFFYQLPFKEMDIFWYGFENDYPASDVAKVMDESVENVEALFRNFRRKKLNSEYLKMEPIRDYYQSK